MKDKENRWEVSGSLTPDIEGAPHSAMHKKRTARRRNPPDNAMSAKDEQRLEHGINVSDLNTTL